LKGLKIGRALRFTEEELMDFIERHREQVEPDMQKTSTLYYSTPKNQRLMCSHRAECDIMAA
jgi:hypothetical protein